MEGIGQFCSGHPGLPQKMRQPWMAGEPQTVLRLHAQALGAAGAPCLTP
ncbi:hypothetical protein [Desulfovibrio sp. ZJ200]|nr:hypothetical protein [Desulfovibrio sp. ZJ200]